jgi:hypothetical protein
MDCDWFTIALEAEMALLQLYKENDDERSNQGAS